jgi:hypothetical protein
MTEKKPYPKRKLQIIKIFADKPFGDQGKTLLPIQAKDLSFSEDSPLLDKVLTFNIFNPDLKAYVQALIPNLGPNTVITVDYSEPIPKEGDDWIPARAITQIYGDDGQPIAARKKQGGFGKSPEIVRLEHELDMNLENTRRVSIEGQKAIEQVGEIVRMEIARPVLSAIEGSDWERVANKYWQAIELMLDRFIESIDGTRQMVKSEVQAQLPLEAKATAPQDAKLAKKNENATDTIKNAGDLLTRAAHLEPSVSRAEVLEVCSVNDVKEITNLNEAWQNIKKYSKSKSV